jgi:hypothetical protein
MLSYALIVFHLCRFLVIDHIGFKRIHCITFGTPPISLLPLNKPGTPHHHKSLFLSFINEGDPVPRADKAYVRSLLELYASPAPGSKCPLNILPSIQKPKFRLKLTKRPHPHKPGGSPAIEPQRWIWKVPPGTLSNAGRLVVLRATQKDITTTSGDDDDVKAEITTDGELREVVFG